MSGSSTTSVILAVVVTGCMLFLVPLVTFSTRIDNVTQEKVRLIVEETVTEVKNTGKLTREMYQNLEDKLAATGNTYEIEVEISVLDENPGKKTAQANYTKIGENLYVKQFGTQILPQIGIKTGSETVAEDAGDTYSLKKGDLIYIGVKSTNSTQAQTFKSSFLGFSNAGENVIKASSSGMCNVDGTNGK